MMEPTEPRRLYQRLASTLKNQIETGVYPAGERMPAERLIAEEANVSRTVVREAIIMLEVEGYVEVRKGSGIHVIARQPPQLTPDSSAQTFAAFGPFELLQARQLIESHVAEFAATQVTRQDIVELMAIQEQARQEDHLRDSLWDMRFHVRIAQATQNSALTAIVENMWLHRLTNPYWQKLHQHIDQQAMLNWCDDHQRILDALMRKDPAAAKLAMWQHLENTRQKLFDATADDFDFSVDRYMFTDNPVILPE